MICLSILRRRVVSLSICRRIAACASAHLTGIPLFASSRARDLFASSSSCLTILRSSLSSLSLYYEFSMVSDTLALSMVAGLVISTFARRVARRAVSLLRSASSLAISCSTLVISGLVYFSRTSSANPFNLTALLASLAVLILSRFAFCSSSRVLVVLFHRSLRVVRGSPVVFRVLRSALAILSSFSRTSLSDNALVYSGVSVVTVRSPLYL